MEKSTTHRRQARNRMEAGQDARLQILKSSLKDGFQRWQESEPSMRPLWSDEHIRVINTALNESKPRASDRRKVNRVIQDWTERSVGSLEFDSEVVKYLEDINKELGKTGPLVPEGYMHPTELERKAVLNFVGEEYNTRFESRWRRVKDVTQDGLYRFMSAGIDGVENMRQGKPSPYRLPKRSEELLDGSAFERYVLAPTDPLLNDFGRANIKLKTAFEVTGQDPKTMSEKDVFKFATILQESDATAHVTLELVRQAHKDLEPLLEGKSEEFKAQAITDYLRRGKERHWKEVARNRGLSIEEVSEWKANNKSFLNASGEHPAPLEAYPNEFRMSQIDEILRKQQRWLR